VTVPVGVDPEPVTATFTLRLVPGLTLADAGVTVTVAVRPVTVSVVVPSNTVYVLSPLYAAARLYFPGASEEVV
jgi:hypothetical protein